MNWKTDRRSWCITLFVACVLIAVVYGPIFLGKVPFPSFFLFQYPAFVNAGPPGPLQVPANIGDLATSFYPFRAIAARIVREGEVPLWNPYMLSGTPLLASAQSAIFYPFTVPYYLLPVPVAWTLSFVVRIVLLMFFTAAFVRRVGGSTTGSLVAAVLVTFCGFLTAWQGQAMHDAAIWLPAICYAIVRLHAEPSTKFVILNAIVCAMPVLAGHPETAAHLILTAVALAAFLAVAKPNRFFVLGFAASGVLAVGLASVQILPTLEWLKYAYHSLVDSWPPQPLWSMLGWVSRDILRSTNSFGLHVPEQATYIGMLAFSAAPLALFHRSRAIVLFFYGWTAVVMSIAYGIGPFFWLSQHAPILQALKNSRFIFVGCFGFAVLAGLGVSAVQEWNVSELRRQRMRAALLMFTGCSAALMLIYVLRLVTTEMSEPSRYPRASAVLLLVSALPLVLRLMGKLKGASFSIATVAIVCLDVSTFAYGFMPFSEARYMYPPIELFERLPKTGEPFRITQMGAAYTDNSQATYGLSAAGGYEVCLRRIKEFTHNLSTIGMDSVSFTSESVLAIRDRRLDMLNARYIVVSQWDPDYRGFHTQPDRFRFLFETGDTEVFENIRALPAAFLVPASGAEVISDVPQAMQRISDPAFDPEQSVILAEPLAGLGPSDVVNPKAGSAVEWASRGANKFELNVSARAPSVLVVSQTFYPGWEAFVDGLRVPVIPANHALTGIAVPEGDHKVRFVFQAPSFKIGLLISAVTVAVLIALAVDSRRVRVKPSDSSNA